MRVSIRYDERPHGLIFRRTMTYATYIVELSDEERAIVRHRNLERYEVTGFTTSALVLPNLKEKRWWHKLPYVGRFIPLRVGDVKIRELLLHRTFIYRYHETALLNDIEATNRSALDNLKNWFEANKSAGRSSVFDI